MLIVNRAGCNGISAHADPTFADQRRRVMIIGQEALDVNELMQMLGRVMRFGQTCEPRYVFVHTPLALEQRAAGRLRQKLNSLNAHTRGDGDNEVTLTADLPPDLTDEHADVAVAAVLREEPDLVQLMGLGRVPEDAKLKDGFAASATLRFALLPNYQAEDLCERIEEALLVRNTPDSPGAAERRRHVEDLRAVVLETREWLPAPAGHALAPKVILSHVACTPLAPSVKYAQARGMVQSTVWATLQKIAVWMAASDQAELTRVAELEALNRPTDKVKARFAVVRAQLVLMACALGATWWKGGDNEGGVAVGLHLRGEQPSDFTHASRQELELVVNSPLRRRRSPLSQLSPYKDQPVWTRVIDENSAGPMFDAGLNRPEERWIVTCGIIRGFSHALDVCTDSQRKPRLVEYSMQDGSIRIWVLMPKGRRVLTLRTMI